MTALHLNLLIQHPELTSPQWPTLGTNGLIQWTDPVGLVSTLVGGPYMVRLIWKRR